MPEPCLLIGDIGGTNARFALADADTPGFSSEQTLCCAEFESADAAIGHFLEGVGSVSPDAICLAAAGPVVNGGVKVTNNHWAIDAADLAASFDTQHVQLLNDFEAIAYSIPFLARDDCITIGLPESEDLPAGDFTVGILGPGTGLGTVGLLRRDGLLYPVVGEAGHVGFAPETQVQIDILRALRDRFDRVSVERIVSGSGLENTYWALTQIHGEKRPALTAEQIFDVGMSNEDPRAAEALQMFFETLGQAAGNVALMLGALDGIYIGGGIVRRYPQLLETSRFRSGFEGKGRHRPLLENIQTQLIMHPQPGLLGTSYFVQQMLQAAPDSASPVL
jgi:glucokinase